MHSAKLFLARTPACENAFRTPLHVFATRGRGTVAQTNLRVAAGVGVVAACLLIGGPTAAVAIADPGRHGSHSGRGDNENRGSNSGGRGGSRGSDWSDNNGSSSRSAIAGSDERPSSRVGSGRDPGTSEERPSSDFSPDPPQFKKPKVTFGDGRTPGVQDHDPEPRWGWSAPEPAPPPPPSPQVITVPLHPPTVSPVTPHRGVVRQLVVAPTAGIVDPLWGVAGLLLIPAAGAILGYRQARGAHAAAELGRHP
jgi:hypothetical protein